MVAGLDLDRVLILDDEGALLRLLARIVEKAGATPCLASNLAEARQLMATNSFACALIDKNLPDGSGLDLLPELKATPAQTDVLVITAHAEMTSAIFALRSGAADYLVKPFSTALVMHRLQQIFERRRLVEERTRLQAQLVRADRMAALGTLAAGVAHELNNPLSFMGLSVESLDSELPKLVGLCEELRGSGQAAVADRFQGTLSAIEHRVEALRTGVQRMRKLSGDLKAYSRGGHEAKVSLQVAESVTNALVMARAQIEKRGRLHVSLEPAPKVLGVRERLEQVVLNLLVNAVQALQDGRPGEVHVRTGTSPTGDAVIEVRDTGAGIAPEVMPRVFEPFFTTKSSSEGTGLGLSISNDIVASFGGYIDVESEVGRGTTFRVFLPAEEHGSLRREDGKHTPTPPPLERARRGKILVVDDEPNVAKLLHDALSVEHDVVALTQAKTALQQLAAGSQYDLIVCDLVMPGMTGMELHAELKKVAPLMAERMLFLTGAASAQGVQAFLKRVDNHFLEKPFMLQELKDAVSGMLREPEAAAQAPGPTA